ncbi:hypothetical protein T01_15010, partial [Trichinella spiralis]
LFGLQNIVNSKYTLLALLSDGRSVLFIRNVPIIVVFLANRSSAAFCFHTAMNIYAATLEET